jgi:hypothetical protein
MTMKTINKHLANALATFIAGMTIIICASCTTTQRERAVQAVFIAADAAVEAKTKEGLDNNAAALKGAAAGLSHLKSVEVIEAPAVETLPEVEVTASK